MGKKKFAERHTAIPYKNQRGRKTFKISLILYWPAPNAMAMDGEPVGVSIAAVQPAKIAIVNGLGSNP